MSFGLRRPMTSSRPPPARGRMVRPSIFTGSSAGFGGFAGDRRSLGERSGRRARPSRGAEPLDLGQGRGQVDGDDRAGVDGGRIRRGELELEERAWASRSSTFLPECEPMT